MLFEFVADIDELRRQFQFNIIQLGDAELCGMFRGALRLNDVSFQLAVATHLATNFDSFNSQVFLLIAKEKNLFEKLKETRYWYCTATVRKTVLSLCEETTEYIEQCKGADFRLIGIANRLLIFTLGDASKLESACQKYVSTIRQIAPEFGDMLDKRDNQEINQFPESSLEYKLLRARTDSAYRTRISLEAKSDIDASFENALILSEYGTVNDIDQFIKNSKSSKSADNLEQYYVRGLVEVIAATKTNNYHGTLKHLAEFLSKFKSEVNSINVQSLKRLCEKLLQLNKSPSVCEILEHLIPKDDLWMSPLIQIYLYALMHCKQLMTLNTLVKNFPDDSKDVDYWKLLSHHHETQSQFVEAIQAIRIAIGYELGDPTLRYHLINLLELKGDENELIEQELGTIPDIVFQKATRPGFYLISKMLQKNIEKGEDFLIDWFLANPMACARPITNIFFGELLQNRDERVHIFKFTTEQCLRALTYSSDGDRRTVLITKHPQTEPSFIDVNSPLGELLLSAEPNSEYSLGMTDIYVHEILPPVVAAFRIALELRDAIQDGTEVFFKLKLPENDPKAMFDLLERKLLKMGNYDDIFSNPEIPIFMKGHLYQSSNPLIAALTQLTQKTSAKPICPNFGESAPSQIVLDIYAAIHIFLSGLDIGLFRIEVRLIISRETEKLISSWLTDINRPDYMTIGTCPDGGLWRTTAEDIQRETCKLQEFLKSLLANSQIVEPKLVDLPPDLIALTTVIDESTLSSIQLSIANEIPWLCIDNLFINLTSKLGCRTVNVGEFYLNIVSITDVVERKHGFFNSVSFRLPVPITFQDLHEMATSQDHELRWVLPEIMMMNAKGMQAQEGLIEILIKIVSAAIVSVNDYAEIRDGVRSFNPTHKGDVERIFNACCYNAITAQNSCTAEERLVPLLKGLSAKFHYIPKIRNLIELLAKRFIEGYFLDQQEIKRISANN